MLGRSMADSVSLANCGCLILVYSPLSLKTLPLLDALAQTVLGVSIQVIGDGLLRSEVTSAFRIALLAILVESLPFLKSMATIYQERKPGKLPKTPPLARVMNSGGVILLLVGIGSWFVLS